MPNQAKTAASSFRFSPDDLSLMDDLGRQLTLPGVKPLSRTDVLRTALHRLAESVRGEKKSPGKAKRGIDTV